MQLGGEVPELAWIVVAGAIASFGVGWGTGANDVANAFGTSVGSKTLTLMQATIIAAVFELAGTLVLGRVTTSVIAGGITDVEFFQREPEMYAYGMLCACIVTFLWQWFSSYMGLNTSTTHSIIGSIVGFAIVYKPHKGVLWKVKDPDSFPPYKGVVPIFFSWIFSPLLTAACSAALFTLIKVTVLHRPNSYQMSFYLLPLFVLITTWVCTYFIITKGVGSYLRDRGDNVSSMAAAWISCIVAGSCALICLLVVMPILRRKAEAAMAARIADEEAKASGTHVEMVKAVDMMKPWEECNWYEKIMYMATYGTNVDIHDVVEDDPVVAEIHRRAETFDPKTEFAFSYLQVFSAICVMFAHGANDSAYAAGPLAGIYTVYMTGTLPDKVQPQIWILVITGISLVIGLATYGYNVTRAMGTKLAKLTASRGFAAELSTAMVIMVASQYGMPTSSSQCITGGIIGIGLCEGLGGLNWIFFAKQMAAWVATLFVCGLGTAAIFAVGIYTPSRVSGRNVQQYEDFLVNITRQILRDINVTITTLPNPYVVPGYPSLLTKLNTTDSKVSSLTNVKKYGTIMPRHLLQYASGALSLVHNNTIYQLGLDPVALEATCSAADVGKCRVPKLYYKNVPLP